MPEIPYKKFFWLLAGVTLSWCFFCICMGYADVWSIADVANWSQAVSVVELLIAFGLALMSDQRIVTMFNRERSLAAEDQAHKRLGLCRIYRRRFLRLFDGGFFIHDAAEQVKDLTNYENTVLRTNISLSAEVDLLIAENYMLLPSAAQVFFDHWRDLDEQYRRSTNNMNSLRIGLSGSWFSLDAGDGTINAPPEVPNQEFAERYTRSVISGYAERFLHLYAAFRAAKVAINACIASSGHEVSFDFYAVPMNINTGVYEPNNPLA